MGQEERQIAGVPQADGDGGDEAPETPTDEPEPIRIEDPPADDTVPPPMSVR